MPIATATFPISAGNVVATTVSRLFASNAAFIAAFANPPTMGNGQPAPMIQQLIVVTSDHKISARAFMLDMDPDGALVTTGAYMFPLASQ